MRDRNLPNAGVEIGNFSGGCCCSCCSCCCSGAGWSCFTWVLTFFRLPDFQPLVFYVGFKVFFWVGAVFPRVFGDFCCANFAKVLIPSCFWCFFASHCSKPRAKHIETHFLNVFHVGFNSFAPEILVFLVGSNVFWVSRASESRVSCGF